MKNVCVLLALFVLAISSTVAAQEFKRFEFSVSGGMTVSGSIPLEAEDGTDLGFVNVDSSYNVGAAFAVYLNELDAIELYWQRQNTDGRLPEALIDPIASSHPAAFDLNMDQYHMNFMHHYDISIPRLRPYVMAGLGATTYHVKENGVNDSLSYFSFSVGAGLKYYLHDHIGLRGEARWSPTMVSASDSSFWCQISGYGGDCLVKLRISPQQQMDLTGSVFFRF